MNHTTSFLLPKSTGLSNRSFDVEVNSNGVPLVNIEHYLRSSGHRPMEVLDMFRHDPDAIETLLRLEMRWDQPTTTIAKPCVVCGKVPDKALRCSGCMEVRMEVVYCGKECQLGHWKTHKKTCGKNVGTRERMAKAIEAFGKK